MRTPSPAALRPAMILAAGALACGTVFVFSFNFIVYYFYEQGAALGDAGKFASMLWHKDLLLSGIALHE